MELERQRFALGLAELALTRSLGRAPGAPAAAASEAAPAEVTR